MMINSRKIKKIQIIQRIITMELKIKMKMKIKNI